ncbi:RICIN domain-containing protein [Streptomyces naphthomycinicus]|uniref:RICIN domain-containing protein n=1 Tax=Streptomyces naphthomycinicus TaxID=2872625 RepID=UPI001CECE625|nr:hypothetical protein [Streptomyces sp. TML10]
MGDRTDHLLEWVAWDSCRYALYRIRDTTASRCMTALGTTAGSRLIIRNCNGSAGQQWRRDVGTVS